jgi:hypothetical protein
MFSESLFKWSQTGAVIVMNAGGPPSTRAVPAGRSAAQPVAPNPPLRRSFSVASANCIV